LPQVTVPIAMSQYVRLPINVGDTGICVAADVRLGAITGANTFGSGQTTLNAPANLSALVFVPLSNKSWSAIYNSINYIMSLVEIELDAPLVSATQNLTVGNGISGSFATGTGLIVTVTGGIITNIYGVP